MTSRRDDATDSLVIESVLAAAESIITYRRRYRSRAQVETLLDLLVLDVSNPRSLAYQVERLADAVGSMPSPEASERQDIDRIVNELATLVALADTNALARVDDDGQQTLTDRPHALGTFLADVTSLLTRLGDQLDLAHFSPQLPQRAVAPMQSLGLLVTPPQERGA